MGTSHRQAPVKNLVGRVREGLAELFALPDGYEVVLGNGGTTAFWDIATFGLIREREPAPVLRRVLRRSSPPVAQRRRSSPTRRSSRPSPGSLAPPQAEAGVDVYAWAHNETSTGVMAPVRASAGADDDALVLVDATSRRRRPAGRRRPRPTSTTSRRRSASPPTAACGSPLMSPAALARVAEIAASGRWIPASSTCRSRSTTRRKDQTYNTPAVATLFLLAEQLDWMQRARAASTGAVARTADSPRRGSTPGPRRRRTRTPFVTDPAQRSLVVGTIDFDDDVDAAAVAKTLRANGIVDTEPYRKLGRNQLRIAMFPAIDPADVAALTACIDYVVAQTQA